MKEERRTLGKLAQPIKSLAQRFAYMGLVLTAFSLMMLGKVDAVLVDRLRTHVTDAVAPILDVLSRPLFVVSAWIERVEALARVHEENAKLREERARLQQWQTAARGLESENKALRDLLNFVPGPDVSFITARVIADTGGAYVQSVLVNAGERDGVRKGQVVVTGDGLIGRILNVGDRSARILLITDLNSRIPVLVEPDRTRAIAAGDNSERPRLVHLPPGAVVSPGDRVVTSGHGGTFPPGLAIGTVASAGDGGITVQPYVDRSRIEYVRIADFGLGGTLVTVGPPRERGGRRTNEGRRTP